MSQTVKAKRPDPAAPPPKAKSPLVAVGLSFAVPGAGQFYLGAWAKGLAFLVVALAMVAYVFYVALQAAMTGDPEQALEQAGSIGLIAGIGFPALMAVAMLDAWLGARKAG